MKPGTVMSLTYWRRHFSRPQSLHDWSVVPSTADFLSLSLLTFILQTTLELNHMRRYSFSVPGTCHFHHPSQELYVLLARFVSFFSFLYTYIYTYIYRPDNSTTHPFCLPSPTLRVHFFLSNCHIIVYCQCVPILSPHMGLTVMGMCTGKPSEVYSKHVPSKHVHTATSIQIYTALLCRF
jgi:hypothetical protein